MLIDLCLNYEAVLWESWKTETPLLHRPIRWGSASDKICDSPDSARQHTALAKRESYVELYFPLELSVLLPTLSLSMCVLLGNIPVYNREEDTKKHSEFVLTTPPLP